ncbi:hypothetical protein [Thalassospira mesophila]|uniref:Uncharacterized protein n=1 Tax=Thalassospira mesophila TaxID=1293891 RepID=A0A1Y2KYN1_9PROT|nr:hypothetical protein [Thalassospira mesophila]OSQ37219.1 hypothetical protein TMES_15535 [Thalassospira mesophila]
MTSSTLSAQNTARSTRDNNTRFGRIFVWLGRFYNACQANRLDRIKIRQIERLDDMVRGDVTGLTREQLDIALRLPAAMARREIARKMRGG